jgi:hypothetical protein
MSEKLNPTLSLPIEQIESFVGIKIPRPSRDYDRIISPRDLKEILCISPFEVSLFERLIRKIPLRNSEEEIYPYENANIRVFSSSPKSFDVGQKFVLESKVDSIIKGEGSLNSLLNKFYMPSLPEMVPSIFYGLDYNGNHALAFYSPPIGEIHNHHPTIIDGIHRTWLVLKIGGNVNSVQISNVSKPLPFNPICWNDCRLVSEKPIKNERYNNLNPSYFRDLSKVGLDG